MLRHLHIENYTLIERLDIDFHQGFSVITGQTGAGKSILLGAISLLTGQRADTTAIQAGKNRCTLEAEFDITGYQLQQLFDDEGLDWDEKNCIIRRELTTTGKSRAFVNDTPVTLTTLKQLGARLLDIHSQHQNLLLGQEDFQLHILDTLAHNHDLLTAYKTVYTSWQDKEKALAQAYQATQQNHQDEDYLRYQLNELETFSPQADEDEALHTECTTLEHAQDIRQSLYATSQIIDSEEACVQMLRQARQQLQDIAPYFTHADEMIQRIESCEIELRDLARQCDIYSQDIECDPQRLEQVRARLNKLYALEQKHHVTTSTDLIAVQNEIATHLNTIDNSEEHLHQLQQEAQQAHAKVTDLAHQLSKTRAKAAKHLEAQMIEQLKPLGMPNIQFAVDITTSPHPHPQGQDNITMLFTANKHTPLQAIQNVASGGEIARVMLTLKAIISTSIQLPTIIFDEIDTGVSGQIAQAMAHIMRHISQQGRQVISITHLPQIAALGDTHYRVWKEETPDATLSHITLLDRQGRIDEIASMLSGTNITDSAIENAKQLLSH